MRTDTPNTIYLKDYKAPIFNAETIDLTFEIFEDKTLVLASTTYKRKQSDGTDLILNGEHLTLLSISLNDKKLEEGSDYALSDKDLKISVGDLEEFKLDIKTEIDPGSNTRLEGLYRSGGNWCTQCEAEGFRTITYFQDRPDILSIFTVKLIADKALCPVLLSNGNLVEEGELEGNLHYTIWNDPFPKPCYLFALVAGKLEYIQDEFTTHSGKNVDLRIYVRDGDQNQCVHAMESLKHSMKWDEEKYGREYQLERFNIVAVSDFNMGAMENTSLNIFNTALVLAHQETATDTDFERVESVIGHEYFHNWTGNRVTCRDWFQLSLKEGLTVFRDQEFSADMNSKGVKRIDDVQMLRKMQFPEDAGPLAHPVRPDNYIEINNFYTMTVYEKGAEVIRMQHTLLGKENYRKATDLYFDRYDGMAVTCDDFVGCMEEASNIDLGQFKLWYSQAGTPEVNAKTNYSEEDRTFTLTLSQTIPDTPGQTSKSDMHIPIKFGLLGPNGDDLIEETVLHLKEKEQSFTFENIPSKPVPSILREFSAPIKLSTDLTNDDLRFLMVHDSDGFNRWEAGQTYTLRMINEMIDGGEIWSEFLDSFGDLLDQAVSPNIDKALLACALTLPSISIIGQGREIVDPGLIHEVRLKIMEAIKNEHTSKLKGIYQDNRTPDEFSVKPHATAQRRLQNVVLHYLDDAELSKGQYDNANNMTDRMAALSVLNDSESAYREEALGDFYQRFKEYELVVNKWFSIQACSVRKQTQDDIRKLKSHAEFTMKNPNRVRALYAAFAMNNPVCFHDVSGLGYEFLGDAVIELNSINPQIASRLLTPLKEWRRYTEDRQKKMKDVLTSISKLDDLSPDVFEIVNKTLAS
jgi:aminopeptidase N